MKFLANENFPVPSVRVLRTLGIEIASIIETTPGISDKEITKLPKKKT